MGPPKIDIPTSVRRATEFLLSRQDPTGYWLDFCTPKAGWGRDWPTGYIIALVGSALPEVVLETAISALLDCRRPDAGWAYNGIFPSDCDSTAICVIALLASGACSRQELASSLKFLLRHQDPLTGGFRAFIDRDALQEYGARMGYKPSLFEGWCKPCVSVTAVALRALGLLGLEGHATHKKGLDFLEHEYSGERGWSCYWWAGEFYPTYQVLELLLRGSRKPSLTDNLANALCQIVDRFSALQTADGCWLNTVTARPCVFSTAMAMRCLQLVDQHAAHEVVFAGAAWLLAHQKTDGGWARSAVLRIPFPDAVNPENVVHCRAGLDGLNEDANRLFSTATVLAALRHYIA